MGVLEVIGSVFMTAVGWLMAAAMLAGWCAALYFSLTTRTRQKEMEQKLNRVEGEVRELKRA